MNHRNIFNKPQRQPKKFTQSTMTIPEQTYSINELLIRSQRGLSLGGSKVAMFEDDPDLTHGINPLTLDYAEIEQIKRENSEIIERSNRNKQKAEKAHKEKEEFEKAFNIK